MGLLSSAYDAASEGIRQAANPFAGPVGLLDAAATAGYNGAARGVSGLGGLLATALGGDPIQVAAAHRRHVANWSAQPRTDIGRSALSGLGSGAGSAMSALDSGAGAVLGLRPGDVAANVSKFYPRASSLMSMGADASMLAPAAGAVRSGVGSLLDAAELRAPLSGAPPITVPNPAVRASARQYAADAGIDYHPPQDFQPADPARGKDIADAYAAMKHDPNDPTVKAAYDALVKETLAQYQAIKKTGLKVDFIGPGAADPYAAGPRMAIDDIRNNNHLHVFPTDSGFGSDASFDAADNPLMAMTDETVNGKRLRANDVFRIVHDYYGHGADGNGFRAAGEEAAWRAHAAMFSPEARRAMTSETRGQNSWVNYGPHGDANRTADTAGTVFADQKTGLLPEKYSDLTAPAAATPPLGATLGGGSQRGAAGNLSRSTVIDPQRIAYPKIYDDPRSLISSAVVAPEDPLLSRLFGVTRSDLSNTALSRKGNEAGILPGAAENPGGSLAATNVMGDANTGRVSDLLAEAQRRPDLMQGMTGWYVMDPAYQRMEIMFGPEEAKRRYRQLNAFTGMSSPGSDVEKELNRGTGANYLATQGRLDDFIRYGGMKPSDRLAAGAPGDMAGIVAHPYHGIHAGPMADYYREGSIMMQSPKVPPYIQASGVPETGFQTDTPVGDAHWARGVGLADTRTAKKGFKDSVSMPEIQALRPWWGKIAADHGLEPVPAQALQWGGMSKATGVKTPVGAPKLELLASSIGRLSEKLGISPESARDMVLRGESYVPKPYTKAELRRRK